MKLNETKIEMVPIMKSVLIVMILIKFMIPKSFAVTPTQNVR